MTNQTIVGGLIGVVGGGLVGLFFGEHLKKALGGDAPELLAIFGGGGGAVLGAAIANAVPAATPLAANSNPVAPTNGQTSSANGTMPPFVPGA
jgi:hypothetical protein